MADPAEIAARLNVKFWDLVVLVVRYRFFLPNPLFESY
jgi:hypothetical protein